MKKGFIIVLGLFFILLNFQFVSSANCGGVTPCNCGDTLNSSHVMDYDLIGCAGDGIKIGADNLVLDCGGYQLTGDGTSTDYGVDNFIGYENITVQNCILVGFGNGIYYSSCAEGLIINNTIVNNTADGVKLVRVNNTLVNDTIIMNNSNGIGMNLFFGSKNNTLIDNTITKNEFGISVDEGSDDNDIIENVLNNNSDSGIYLGNSLGGDLFNNTLKNNLHGIFLRNSSYNNITDNNASINFNAIHLINDCDNNTIVSNILRDNNNSGIYVENSTWNMIENNTANNNSVGISLISFGLGGHNNFVRYNVLTNNFNSIFDNIGENNSYSYNYLLSDHNGFVFDPQFNRSIQAGQAKNFTVSVSYPNRTTCLDFTVNNITITPNDNIDYTITSENITVNFIPSNNGLYSLFFNITDDQNNNIEQRFYLGNQTTLGYYFRPDVDASHGQPTGTDAASLLFDAPVSESSFDCGVWVQSYPDNVSENISGISRIINIDFSFWYTLDSNGFVGFKKTSEWDKYVGLGIFVSNSSDYSRLEDNFDVGSWVYNISNWYHQTFKLGGYTPFIKTNQTDPGTINFTYLITDSPEIKNISNENVKLYSATTPANNLYNATISLAGVGTTNLTVRMNDTRIEYNVTLNGDYCPKTNCTYTQDSGTLVLNLSLGDSSEITHSIEVFGINPVSTSNIQTSSSGSSSSSYLNQVDRSEGELEFSVMLPGGRVGELELGDNELGLRKIFINAKNYIRGTILVKQADPDEVGCEVPGIIYKAWDIEHDDISDEDINSVSLAVAVSKNWLKTYEITQVRAVRCKDNKIEFLDLLSEGDEVSDNIYEIKGDGFSFWSIIGLQNKEIVIDEKETILPGEEIKDDLFFSHKFGGIFNPFFLFVLYFFILLILLIFKIKKNPKFLKKFMK